MTRLLPAMLALAVNSAFAAPLTSPDRHIAVELRITAEHRLEYTVQRDGHPVILPFRLGLRLEGAKLDSQLKLVAASPVKPIADHTDLDLDLGFLAGREGQLITDGGGEREFSQSLLPGGRRQMTIKAHGGFVAVFK